jgi:hypothetical protein
MGGPREKQKCRRWITSSFVYFRMQCLPAMSAKSLGISPPRAPRAAALSPGWPTRTWRVPRDGVCYVTTTPQPPRQSPSTSTACTFLAPNTPPAR